MFDQSVNWTDRLRDLDALNPDFEVVVLFDNEKCGVDAFRATWRLLACIKPGTRVDARLWQCDTVKDQNQWQQLQSHLAKASAVIIATQGDTRLRSAVVQWSRVLFAETQLGELILAVLERGVPFLLETKPARKAPCG